MSNRNESNAAETLTEDDLAQVNGGITLQEFIAKVQSFGVGIVPSPGFGSFITRIAVNANLEDQK